VNIYRTLCYHFATQLGSTHQYKERLAKPAESISDDKSTLIDTEQNASRWPRTHYECVALPAELQRRNITAVRTGKLGLKPTKARVGQSGAGAGKRKCHPRKVFNRWGTGGGASGRRGL